MQIEILRIIPRLPASIEAKTIHEKLKDLGFNRDLRSIQRTLQALCLHFDDLECNNDIKPYTYYWKERSAGFALPVLNEQQSLLLKLAEKQLKYLLPANIMSSMKPFSSKLIEWFQVLTQMTKRSLHINGLIKFALRRQVYR